MAEHSHGRRIPDAIKVHIVQYSTKGYSDSAIVKLLSSEKSFHTTRSPVTRFLKRYNETSSLTSVRIGSPKKIMPVHRQLIDMWLGRDNELSTVSLQRRLEEECGVKVSLFYIRKIRNELGWTTKRLQYCQMISHKNKQVRLDWCSKALREKETFQDVIFVDETTVEMSSCGRIFFHKATSDIQVLPSRKPKPKHSYKVHVWGGISYNGRTNICIFTGIMDSLTYQGILERNLLPFAAHAFPNGFRLYQDNDSKHNSRSTKTWMEEKGISNNVMSTPPSSPDLNPIENLWSALKLHLCSRVKPKKKNELVEGIQAFWESLTVQQCTRYIDHIHKVIPAVILNDGNQSGY